MIHTIGWTKFIFVFFHFFLDFTQIETLLLTLIMPSSPPLNTWSSPANTHVTSVEWEFCPVALNNVATILMHFSIYSSWPVSNKFPEGIFISFFEFDEKTPQFDLMRSRYTEILSDAVHPPPLFIPSFRSAMYAKDEFYFLLRSVYFDSNADDLFLANDPKWESRPFVSRCHTSTHSGSISSISNRK